MVCSAGSCRARLRESEGTTDCKYGVSCERSLSGLWRRHTTSAIPIKAMFRCRSKSTCEVREGCINRTPPVRPLVRNRDDCTETSGSHYTRPHKSNVYLIDGVSFFVTRAAGVSVESLVSEKHQLNGLIMGGWRVAGKASQSSFSKRTRVRTNRRNRA